MAAQLDILALEPFYGGARRAMLETLIRCSRHRWTLLKLPPRRLERRLAVAAYWFAEQLSRHWVGRVDLLFTSEAMNLADLNRLMPSMAKLPSVVYFHDNQLPAVEGDQPTQNELANLSTAMAAGEIWFNSQYHQNIFEVKASALVARHPELMSRNPMPEVVGKSVLMVPPMDLHIARHLQASEKFPRRPHAIFLPTRDADMELLNRGLTILQRRGEDFELVTVGPLDDLSLDFPRSTITEVDDYAQVAGMLQSGIFLSGRFGATCDHQAALALSAKCWPVLPADGAYNELIPQPLHAHCLYDGSPDGLCHRIQDSWHQAMPDQADEEIAKSLTPFDAIHACRAMDERLEQIVSSANGNLRR